MGEDAVNVASWAHTFEAGALGWTLCLGLGRLTGGVAPFHRPSPLLTTAQAQAAWSAARSGGGVPALRAALPPPARAWLDQLPTAQPDPRGGPPIDLQQAAVWAAASGAQPAPPPPLPPGVPAPY